MRKPKQKTAKKAEPKDTKLALLKQIAALKKRLLKVIDENLELKGQPTKPPELREGGSMAGVAYAIDATSEQPKFEPHPVIVRDGNRWSYYVAYDQLQRIVGCGAYVCCFRKYNTYSDPAACLCFENIAVRRNLARLYHGLKECQHTTTEG